ncbi:MAG: hypothetical protein L3J07_00405 [Candidatus Magasanikbacteria bacterium]|nr:hypothetical protein [Candidatus Magasanikbacteria bacterium]
MSKEKKNIKGLSVNSDTKKLLEANLEISKRIEIQNKKLLKKFKWMLISNYIRLALIVVPFILAAIFLPAYIAKFLEDYNAIISQTSNFPDVSELLKYLKQ